MKELPEIKKPVFILGPERSGTTLLYSILANADEFYWFSRIDSLIPGWPRTAKITRRFFSLFQNNPYIAHPGKISQIKGINTPTECNAYWKKIFGWGDEQNYLIDNDRFLEGDLSEEQIQFIYEDFSKRLSYSGKKRMLLKQPGFSLKLRFWNHVFPDAHYLICIRNLDDNICSLVKAKQESDENFWGTKVDGWKNYMTADYQTQAILQLKKIYSLMADDLENENIAQKTMIVSYDRLLANPEDLIKEVVQFCEVRLNDRMKIASEGIIRQDPPDNPGIDFTMPPREIIQELRKRADDYFASNGSGNLRDHSK